MLGLPAVGRAHAGNTADLRQCRLLVGKRLATVHWQWLDPHSARLSGGATDRAALSWNFGSPTVKLAGLITEALDISLSECRGGAPSRSG